MERKMFLNASHIIFETAKKLRQNQTESEKILWSYPGTKPFGYNFRRQYPLSTFIADFYCHPLKLIIEIDGRIHETEAVKKYDKERQEFLEANGIAFLRFTNEEVESNLSQVILKIQEYIRNAELQGLLK
jgi:imidazole glycerol-phosphate synthase subunit HisF